MTPSEAQSLFNIQLQVQIEVLKARVISLRKYSLNTRFQLEADVIDDQISNLRAKHDSSTKHIS